MSEAVVSSSVARSRVLAGVLSNQFGLIIFTAQDGIMILSVYTLASAVCFVFPIGYLFNQVVDIGSVHPRLRWEWWPPSAREIGLLALLGTIGMVATTRVWRACQVAPASIIAPLDYSYLVWAGLVDFLFWDEIPALTTVCGMFLITGSGLYIAVREMMQAQRADRPAPTAEIVVAPANVIPDPSVIEGTTIVARETNASCVVGDSGQPSRPPPATEPRRGEVE